MEAKTKNYSLVLENAAKAFLEALSNSPYNNKPFTDAQVVTNELLKFLSNSYKYNPNAINELKPAWSKEDEKMWTTVSDLLWEGYKQSDGKVSWKRIRNWLLPKIMYHKNKILLSQSIDEEAEEFNKKQGIELAPFAKKFFKAGAKWMAKQV